MELKKYFSKSYKATNWNKVAVIVSIAAVLVSIIFSIITSLQTNSILTETRNQYGINLTQLELAQKQFKQAQQDSKNAEKQHKLDQDFQQSQFNKQVRVLQKQYEAFNEANKLSISQLESFERQRKTGLTPVLFFGNAIVVKLCIHKVENNPIIFNYLSIIDCEENDSTLRKRLESEAMIRKLTSHPASRPPLPSEVKNKYILQCINKSSGTAKDILISWSYNSELVQALLQKVYKEVSIKTKSDFLSIALSTNEVMLRSKESNYTNYNPVLSYNESFPIKIPDDYMNLFIAYTVESYIQRKVPDQFPPLNINAIYEDIENKKFVRNYIVAPRVFGFSQTGEVIHFEFHILTYPADLKTPPSF